MRGPRRAFASIVGLGLGLAGCDTVPTQSASAPAAPHAGSLLPHDVAFVALVLGFGFAALLFASIVRQAVAHRRVSRRLAAAATPAVVAGVGIGIVPGAAIAMVAGVLRPKTYVSGDVLVALDPDELAAVLAHERHHEATRAPLRLILLAGIAAPLRFATPIARRLDRARARLEIEADAHAIAEGSTRQSIARAIIKLSGAEAASATASFAASADLRLRVLLGDATPTTPGWRDDVLVVASIAILVIVACSAMPL